jgi:hypothetical protein
MSGPLTPGASTRLPRLPQRNAGPRLKALIAHRCSGAEIPKALGWVEQIIAEARTEAAPTCACMSPGTAPAYHCVCREDPAAGPAHEGHATWCPARKPTPERVDQIRRGIGDELTRDELEWLKGTAGRNEAHIIGARGGHWPMRDLPGAVLLLAQYLAATVAVIERAMPDAAGEKDSATAAPTSTPRPDDEDTTDDEDEEPETPASRAAAGIQALHDPSAVGYMHPGDRLGLVLAPATEAQWTTWQTRLGLDPGHTTYRSGWATGRGTWNGVRVLVDCDLSRVTFATLRLRPRVAQLLTAIQKDGGRWTTGRVLTEVYRPLGITQRATAKGDLAQLEQLGHLTAHGPADGRYYLRKDGQR